MWWTFLCSSENSVQGISHSDSLVSREHLILFEKVTLQGQPVLLLRLNSCSTFFNCPSFSARAIKSVFRLPTLNSGMCQNISFNIQNPWEQKHVFINKSLVTGKLTISDLSIFLTTEISGINKTTAQNYVCPCLCHESVGKDLQFQMEIVTRCFLITNMLIESSNC